MPYTTLCPSRFTFTCDGSLARAPVARLWQEAEAIASQALSGRVAAVVGTATHYRAAYVAPRWRSTLERVAQMGAHIFYRNQESARLTGKYSGEEPVLPAILTLERRVGAQGSIQGKHEEIGREHV